jgi:hypothetical protein
MQVNLKQFGEFNQTCLVRVSQEVSSPGKLLCGFNLDEHTTGGLADVQMRSAEGIYSNCTQPGS